MRGTLNAILTCSNGPISSTSWHSTEEIEMFLTGRTNLAGDVNRYKPGYAPLMLKGTYPTSRSSGICNISFKWQFRNKSYGEKT